MDDQLEDLRGQVADLLRRVEQIEAAMRAFAVVYAVPRIEDPE